MPAHVYDSSEIIMLGGTNQDVRAQLSVDDKDVSGVEEQFNFRSTSSYRGPHIH
jgi:hypothetical protein